MTLEAWRDMVACYVETRLGADQFRANFLASFEDCCRARRPVPVQIQQLYFVVEAYGGCPSARAYDFADDEDLARAAHATLAALPAKRARLRRRQ